MPEEKSKKTVDIDTSGPGAEVDVAEEKVKEEGVVETEATEQEPEIKLPTCVADCCAYPETWRWNGRCMEEGMRVSKEAKMAREEAIQCENGEGDQSKE